MELWLESTLNVFTSLSSDYDKSDELNLEAFVKYKYRKSLNDFSYYKSGLEQIKTIIDAIEFPDKYLLSEDHANLFNLRSYGNLLPSYMLDKLSLNQAGLQEEKDYVIISYPVSSFVYSVTFSNNNSSYYEYCKDHSYKNVRTLLSFNGLKKLVNYMHLQALVKIEGYGNHCMLSKALDFEIVYKKTKEFHSENRKNYLAELARVNQ